MKSRSLLFILSCSVMIRCGLTMMTTHVKCRNALYPRSEVMRFHVPDDKVHWSIDYSNYKPPNYTSPGIYGKAWADPDIGAPGFHPAWNNIDGDINRMSHMEGGYMVIENFPLNPIGRTGITGRGVLGRWGPNHAADPVVTRWKTPPNSKVDTKQNPVLQFVAIKRNDTGEWALPGGMVDPGEKVTATAVREFQEEAINSLKMSDDEKQIWKLEFDKFFTAGDEIYKGYVDDPRNTDNAWMETIAYNFHDESGDIVGKLKLHAGDDAVGVCWVDITPDLKLYASHRAIVDEVLNRHMSPEKYNKDKK